MRLSPILRTPASSRRRGASVRVGSLAMVFQRSALLPLLPEARLLATSGFSEALKWTVATVAGLGAFDSVSGASQMTQLLPTQGSLTVNAVAGDSLNFVFQTTGTPHVPTGYLTTTLPPGLTLTGTFNSPVESITGTPTQAGTYPVTITAWELPGYSGDSFSQAFTFQIVNPPQPEITVPPAGGNFSPRSFVSLSAGQNNGRTFAWTRNGAEIPVRESIFCARNAVRKFRAAPAADPGTAWRSGEPFVESVDLSSQTDPAWSTVTGGIGYDANGTTGGNFLPAIAAGAGNLQTLMFGTATPAKPVAVHLRMQFTLPTPEILAYLTLRVQSDDGFVAWLNGTEIASQNKPASLAWNSAASAEVSLDTPATFREINISQFLNVLRPGGNLLAVQAMNRSPASPDFLFNCELAAGINGVNSPYLLLTNLQPSVAGAFALTVTNPAGSVTTDPAPVLVIPSILSQPSSVTIESGATAQLAVTPDGSPPFFFQWYAGSSGDTSSPVAGAAQAVFTTPSLTETGSFWVRVLTPAGTADSDTAVVTVSPLPDSYSEWRAARFSAAEIADSTVSGPGADPDGDGFTNEQEYVFGTFPQHAEDALPPVITANGGQIDIAFTARKAAGAGYAGRTRHYSVETTGNPASGPWTTLPSAADITAEDQPVAVVLPHAPSRSYCRLRVWLTP